MAIYHLNYKHISRGKNQSACAAAAYRSATQIYDQRLGKTHNYENKKGVDYKEILAPSYAPQWVNNRPQLWNEVEKKDTRINARPASELDIALPIELNPDQQIKLIKHFAQTTLVSRGLIVDLACHDLNRHNPHAHLLFTTRKINEQGLGEKDRDIKTKDFLNHLRKTWEEQANEALSQAKTSEQIDHRSLEAQGINRIPQIHLGPNVCQMEARGIETDRGDEWREINQANTRINQLLETENRLEEEQENLKTLIQQSQTEQPPEDPSSKLQPTEQENNPLIINSPTILQNQIPLYATNPLVSKSLAELSAKDGKQIKEKQAINLFHQYQPLLNQIANQVSLTGNKELKLGNQNQKNQWRIGINEDETEFWIINDSQQETKIYLRLTENNELLLKYKIKFGEFHNLYSNLPEEIELKLRNNQLTKQEPEPPIKKEHQPQKPTTEESEDLTLDSSQQELSRNEYIKYIINPAISIVARQSQTFSEFINQLQNELITVEQKQQENQIKLYYKLQLGENIIVAEDIELEEATLPALIQKGIHYQSPSENNKQQINKNHYQPDHFVIDTNPNSKSEEQSRERIEEENRQEEERLRQLQEEEQRKQAQHQKTRKTKKRNQDKDLEL